MIKRRCGQWHSAISCPACVALDEANRLRQRVEELEGETGVLTQGITDQHDRAEDAEDRLELRELHGRVWQTRTHAALWDEARELKLARMEASKC